MTYQVVRDNSGNVYVLPTDGSPLIGAKMYDEPIIIPEPPEPEPIIKPVRRRKTHKTDLKAKLAALERDNYSCSICGSTEWIEVHHLKYRSKGGTDNLDNLICLCDICHAKQHEGENVHNIMMKQISHRRMDGKTQGRACTVCAGRKTRKRPSEEAKG